MDELLKHLGRYPFLCDPPITFAHLHCTRSLEASTQKFVVRYQELCALKDSSCVCTVCENIVKGADMSACDTCPFWVCQKSFCQQMLCDHEFLHKQVEDLEKELRGYEEYMGGLHQQLEALSSDQAEVQPLELF